LALFLLRDFGLDLLRLLLLLLLLLLFLSIEFGFGGILILELNAGILVRLLVLLLFLLGFRLRLRQSLFKRLLGRSLLLHLLRAGRKTRRVRLLLGRGRHVVGLALQLARGVLALGLG
jgi:hypothetical protein